MSRRLFLLTMNSVVDSIRILHDAAVVEGLRRVLQVALEPAENIEEEGSRDQVGASLEWTHKYRSQ